MFISKQKKKKKNAWLDDEDEDKKAEEEPKTEVAAEADPLDDWGEYDSFQA